MFAPEEYNLPFNPREVAIQGQLGSFSEHTLRRIFGDAAKANCCQTFPEAFQRVTHGDVGVGVIPIINNIAGSVPYVNNLLKITGLRIVGEYILPIEMCLVGVRGAKVRDISHVHSHIHALNQCKDFLEGGARRFNQVVNDDTAGAAKLVAEMKDKKHAAISSSRAAELYGLDVIERGIQDEGGNKTRFLVLVTKDNERKYQVSHHSRPHITAITFSANRTNPYVLVDALQILKENGVLYSNLYQYTGDNFGPEAIYLEMAGHVHDHNIAKALKELKPSVAKSIDVVGSFPAHTMNMFGRGLNVT